MIVTTINSIEGKKISRYNDPIAANVVIGATFFSDIGACYADSSYADKIYGWINIVYFSIYETKLFINSTIF